MSSRQPPEDRAGAPFDYGYGRGRHFRGQRSAGDEPPTPETGDWHGSPDEWEPEAGGWSEAGGHTHHGVAAPPARPLAEEGFPEELYPEDHEYIDEHEFSAAVEAQHSYVAGHGYDGYDEPAYATGGGRRPRRHRLLTTVTALVAVVVLILAAVGYHYEKEINPSGNPGKLVSVTIPSDTSSARIGEILAGAGIIHGSNLFRYYVKVKGDGPLLPGTYQLAKNESYDSVIAALTAGPPHVTEKLVIPEGYTLAQIADRVAALPKLHLSAAKFLQAESSGQVRSPYEPAGVNDLEGLVYPATYEIREGMTESDVLQMLVARFNEEAVTLGLTQGAAALGMTPYQVVTVASIVEREAKLDGDRAYVASAIYNRLKKGMTLGADSTLVYALRKANPSVNINSIDYNQPSPYNTRIHKGLPPTPISNPGLPSLTAAVHPPATTYLYFVEVNPDGQLGFASTSTGFDHLQAQCRAAHLC